MTSSNIVPATFHRREMEYAYTRLLVKYQRDPAWINALNRAWSCLTDGASVERPWFWFGNALRIASESTAGRRYWVTADGCECTAASRGLMCKHMASWWMCHEAEDIATILPPHRTRTGAEIEAAAAELFT